MKMNLLNKVAKVLSIGVIAASMVGCASTGGIAQKYVNNNSVEGVIYGAGLEQLSIKNICDAIKNKDDRCNKQSDFKVVAVAAKVGYADGFVGMTAFAPISMDIGKPCSSGSSDCTYLKTLVEKNRLGTVLEVASRPGENKCKWSGMPRAGGTVCTTPAWDYQKDGQAAIAR
jgi:hypothetical protein